MNQVVHARPCPISFACPGAPRMGPPHYDDTRRDYDVADCLYRTTAALRLRVGEMVRTAAPYGRPPSPPMATTTVRLARLARQPWAVEGVVADGGAAPLPSQQQHCATLA